MEGATPKKKRKKNLKQVAIKHLSFAILYHTSMPFFFSTPTPFKRYSILINVMACIHYVRDSIKWTLRYGWLNWRFGLLTLRVPKFGMD